MCRDATHRRELEPGGARLEQPVDEAAVDLRDPHDRREAERGRMTDEPEHVGLGELRMLVVDDAEVERGRTEVDRLERRQLDERADERVFAEPSTEA